MIRDRTLTLIQVAAKGLPYAAIQKALKVESARLDPALLGLIADGIIRPSRKGYVPVNPTKEAMTYGSAAPMRRAREAIAEQKYTFVCVTCNQPKSPADFYGVSRECKGCAKKRVAENNRQRTLRKHYLERRLLAALAGISKGSCGCAKVAGDALKELVVPKSGG